MKCWKKRIFYYDQMYDFLTDLDQFIPVMDMPKYQEPFSAKSEISLLLEYMVSGANGGGGYIAQILSHWDGYTEQNV